MVREPEPGLIATTTRAADGSRLLHLINVTGVPLTSTYTLDGEPLLGGEQIELPPRTGAALLIGVRVGDRVVSATAEIEAETLSCWARRSGAHRGEPGSTARRPPSARTARSLADPGSGD